MGTLEAFDFLGCAELHFPTFSGKLFAPVSLFVPIAPALFVRDDIVRGDDNRGLHENYRR